MVSNTIGAYNYLLHFLKQYIIEFYPTGSKASAAKRTAVTFAPLFFFSALSFSSISMFSFSINDMRVLQRLWNS